MVKLPIFICAVKLLSRTIHGTMQLCILTAGLVIKLITVLLDPKTVGLTKKIGPSTVEFTEQLDPQSAG